MKGNNEHITYKIKDQGGTIQSGDLGAVANPFRQIRYLAIRGERYSGYNQVELRLHAMGVYAGAQTSVPEPEDKDGTTPIIPEQIPEVDSYIDEVGTALQLWWTGWWPLLHILVADDLDTGASYEVEISIDLCSQISLEKFDLYHPSVESMNTTELDEAVDGAYISYNGGPVPHIELMKWIIIGILLTVDSLSAPALVLPPPIYQILLALLAAASLLFIVYIYSIYDSIVQGYMDSGAALTTLFEMMVYTMGVNVVSSYSARSAFLNEFWKRRGLLNYGTVWIQWGSTFHLVNVVVKVVFFVICLVMFLYYTGMWLELY